jgi:hypothetical protein
MGLKQPSVGKNYLTDISNDPIYRIGFALGGLNKVLFSLSGGEVKMTFSHCGFFKGPVPLN